MDSRIRSLNCSISAEKAVHSGAVPTEEKVLTGKLLSPGSDLKGGLQPGGRVLSGQITPDDPLRGNLPGTLELHYSPDAVPEYKGPYEVIPKVEAQTLDTAGKLMRKDVEVYAVPYFEVSNTTGGSTVYIAKSTNA